MLTRKATRSGLPDLRDYFRETWHFRTFALRWSAADVKARNFETAFGRAWHVINPLLFGLIYFIFVGILSGGGLDSISMLAAIIGNLYLWLFFSSIINSSIGAIQSGAGGILIQSAIPRIVIPIASTITSTNLFMRSLIAYVPIHLVSERGLHIEMLYIPLIVVLTGLFGFGLSLLLATLNVYARDVSRLVPHVLRLWLYLSPVIWLYTRVLGESSLDQFARLNPLYPAMTAWTIALGGHIDPSGPRILEQIGIFSLWTFAVLAPSVLIFISKEDEFAIRN